MKKKFAILLFILIPFFGNALMGSYKNYSFFYGIHHTSTSNFSNNFEILYDFKSSSCLTGHRRPRHYGFGLNATFSGKYEEYGIKGFYNPFRISLRVTRKSSLTPYAFLQTNIKRTYETHKSEYNIRPGIGLNYYHRTTELLAIRSSFQIGYSINKNPIFKNSFVMEFKIGVGLNSIKYYLNRRKRNKEIKL